MASVRDDLVQAVREWFKRADVCSLTDKQIIPANAKGTRPDRPYLTVNVLTLGNRVGAGDETLHRVNDTDPDFPEIRARGERTATVSIQGFGDEAGDWMEGAVLSLIIEKIRDSIKTAGFTFRPLGGQGVQSLADKFGSGFEQRYSLDIEAAYKIAGPWHTEALADPNKFVIDLPLPT